MLLVLAFPLSAQVTSDRRIPVTKRETLTVRPKPLPRDTVRVHDTATVFVHDTARVVEHESTTDTVSRRTWVPLPFPCLFWGCPRRTRTNYFAAKPETLTVTRVLPGVPLPPVHDTTVKIVEHASIDTLFVPQFATDTLFITRTLTDSLIRYLPGQIITIYRDTCDTPPVVTSTPEPATVVLVGSGLIGVGLVRRRIAGARHG